MSASRVPRFLLLVLAVPVIGCHEITCDLAPPYAIYVAVRDSVTGRPIALGTTGTVEAFGTRDTLLAGDSLYLYSSRNVPGNYRVELMHPGYAPWMQDNVAVVHGPCGGGNVGVYARLRPL
jgi:hypothetical protein